MQYNRKLKTSRHVRKIRLIPLTAGRGASDQSIAHLLEGLKVCETQSDIYTSAHLGRLSRCGQDGSLPFRCDDMYGTNCGL